MTQQEFMDGLTFKSPHRTTAEFRFVHEPKDNHIGFLQVKEWTDSGFRYCCGVDKITAQSAHLFGFLGAAWTTALLKLSNLTIVQNDQTGN